MIINRIEIRDGIFAQHLNIDMINLQKYLKWLSDKESNPFIVSTQEKWDQARLISFIMEQNNSKQTALIGIFDQSIRNHIGNIKYENVYFGSTNCTLGILIGELNYRGIGIGTAVISETIKYFSENFNIYEFFLGVNKSNEKAIKTYRRLGFRVVDTSEANESIRMSFRR
jgi:ribosomal-protein-alanine N-acetyltransferase